MLFVGSDTETELIEPGIQSPRLVCMQVCAEGNPGRIFKWDEKAAIVELLQACVRGDILLIFHNAAFDMHVILKQYPDLWQLIFQVYDSGNLWCTQLAEQMLLIYDGMRYEEIETEDGDLETIKATVSLEEVARRHLGIDLEKGESTWRLRYGLLRDEPVSSWPEDAIGYALHDVDILPAIVRRQLACRDLRAVDLFYNLPEQCRGAFGLQEMADNGLPIDEERLENFVLLNEVQKAKHRKVLVDAGFVDPKTGSRRDKLLKEYIGRTIPNPKMTKPSKKFPEGQISADKFQAVMSKDPILVSAARYKAIKDNVLKTYVKWFKTGVGARGLSPSKRVNPMVETGRAASGLHMTLPRNGPMRNIVRPPEGEVFINCDYDTAELRSLGQSCWWLFGKSTLKDIFIDPDADPHTEFAAKMVGIDRATAYAWKAAGDPRLPRQQAKAPNFGFPGGMRALRFYSSQVEEAVKEFLLSGKWKEPPTLEQAEALEGVWHQTYPEMRSLFAFAGNIANSSGLFQTPTSYRYRGGVGYCDGLNYQFQPITADGAKKALYEIVRATYTPGDVLFGWKVINFIHDEIMLRGPKEAATAVGQRVSQLMVECMAGFTPDVPPRAGVTISTYWDKAAKSKFKNGEYSIWQEKSILDMTAGRRQRLLGLTQALAARESQFALTAKSSKQRAGRSKKLIEIS